MRVVFIGGTKRGYKTLKALIDADVDVVGIISLLQDKHEVENYENQIRRLAQASSIPMHETKWMKEQKYVDLIHGYKPDLLFIVGCRIIISSEIYNVPLLGSYAVHDSHLPYYRGFAPLNWSLINGEEITGVSLFRLNNLMDGGDIVLQQTLPINSDDDAPSVYEKICDATVELVVQAYTNFSKNEESFIAQNYCIGSFTCSRTPEDGVIHWSSSTKSIYNQVRALTYPYPGAFTFYELNRLTIWKAKIVDHPPNYVGRIPGRVIHISKVDGFVDVLTGDGILRIFEVQLENNARTTASNIIKSVKSTLGLGLPDLLSRIKLLEQEILRLQQHEK